MWLVAIQHPQQFPLWYLAARNSLGSSGSGCISPCWQIRCMTKSVSSQYCSHALMWCGLGLWMQHQYPAHSPRLWVRILVPPTRVLDSILASAAASRASHAFKSSSSMLDRRSPISIVGLVLLFDTTNPFFPDHFVNHEVSVGIHDVVPLRYIHLANQLHCRQHDRAVLWCDDFMCFQSII